MTIKCETEAGWRVVRGPQILGDYRWCGVYIAFNAYTFSHRLFLTRAGMLRSFDATVGPIPSGISWSPAHEDTP